MSTVSQLHPAVHPLEELDRELRDWAMGQGGDEESYPVLIDAAKLTRAGYPDAFPHLLMTTAVLRDPAAPMADTNVAATDWCLSPAVCYHTYAALEGRTLDPGVLITARGHCFRNEEPAALAPGRRQIEFQMRELVLVGAPDWIEEHLRVLQPEVEDMARAHGLDGVWCPASDPFFLPRARGKAQMQRLLGTKIEWCLPDGLAVASINRHGAFFGERFQIRTAQGATAHSACVAFGLDRWAAHASSL
jgi:hypothetical protein